MDEPLSPIEAASAIREVGAWSEQLRQRTVGLTWMFWGIVTPAIFVTYALAAPGLAAGDAPWLGLLWVPWAALGLLFTALLWRSGRVALASPALSTRELAVHAALFVAATVGSVLLVVAARLPIAAPTAVLAGIGLLAAMLGVRDAFGEARGVGVVHAAGGIALLGFAVSEALVTASEAPADALYHAALANAVASALVLVAVGAFRVARS